MEILLQIFNNLYTTHEEIEQRFELISSNEIPNSNSIQHVCMLLETEYLCCLHFVYI